MSNPLHPADSAMLSELAKALDQYATCKQAAVEARITKDRADRALDRATLDARVRARTQAAGMTANGKPLLADHVKDIVAQAVDQLTAAEQDAATAADEAWLLADANLSLARESLRAQHAQIAVWTAATR